MALPTTPVTPPCSVPMTTTNGGISPQVEAALIFLAPHQTIFTGYCRHPFDEQQVGAAEKFASELQIRFSTGKGEVVEDAD